MEQRMGYSDRIGVRGRALIHLELPDPADADRIHVAGATLVHEHEGPEGVALTWERSNAFVNQGLEDIGDRWTGLGGTGPTHLVLTSDATAVTATTVEFDPGADADLVAKAFDAGYPSRTDRTWSFRATFQRDPAATPTPLDEAPFVITKLGLASGAADGNMLDAIGGGGTDPYDESLSLDFTGAKAYTLRPQVDVTLVAV